MQSELVSSLKIYDFSSIPLLPSYWLENDSHLVEVFNDLIIQDELCEVST